ncbi:S53 family peptidase [Ferrimicrobium acidiphilum]|uniref:Pseudomonalisin n=1 Tax=Ferrimicrobium acidiphilum DSM 19497 TaxID=1121877 RepID=A0A0D8FWC4_9ACTN|nr:S53 family peptidase [Ferrimicrobium acidiphilum]KJE76562.1 pseudomonalisin precursor [Ferrimicrobium acidiphilum DSM 19497]
MKKRFTRHAVTLGAAGVLGIATMAMASPVTSLTASQALAPKVSVPGGLAPGIAAESTPTGATASTTQMRVSFILKGQNIASLQSKVDAGWTGPYLTPMEFAQQYGQTQQYVKQLISYLNSYGIQAQAMTDMLDVTSQGTAAEYQNALSVLFDNYEVPASSATVSSGPAASTQQVFAATHNPQLPSNLATNIEAVLGLTNYAPYQSLSIPGKAQVTPGSTAASGGTIPTGTAPSSQLPQAFEKQYHLTTVLNAGSQGQGQTMGIVTLASVNPKVPAYFWENVAHIAVLPNRLTLVNVDGGAGAVSLNNGSDETTIDVEQSGSIAPQAKIVVYQAPNTDYGFVDAFYQAASQNVAGSLSASWGESETAIQYTVAAGQESPGYAAAFNQAYLESAAQGQSVFVSSGDQGAYSPTGDIGTYNLGVDSPEDSPYVTSVGGTTLPGTQVYPITDKRGSVTGYEEVNIPKQLTWGWDYLWPMYQALGASSESAAAGGLIVGSGGGYSALFNGPSYQAGVGASGYSDYQFINPTSYQDISPTNLYLPTSFTLNPAPGLSTGTNAGFRATPDVAFNADPQTGYVAYDPQFVQPFGSALVDFGGTSFIGPQLNGVTAVYESSLGHRIGFWNPNIYRFAASSNSPFHPLDSNTVYSGPVYYSGRNHGKSLQITGEFTNTNDYYTGTSGAIYNPGSGLGYANLSKLLIDFAGVQQ